MHHHGENLNGIKGSPPHKNDIQPRKEPKPGAKIVRWSDSINRPLEQVREFEIIPNERGLSSLISYLNQLIEIHNFVSLYSSLTPAFHGHINISPSHNKTNDAVVFEMTFLTFKKSPKNCFSSFSIILLLFKNHMNNLPKEALKQINHPKPGQTHRPTLPAVKCC